MSRAIYLTEKQWKEIAPLLPKLRSSGRPWKNNRLVIEGILWILRTGARWKDLPEKYPSPSTCWRRLKLWEEQGVWEKIWRIFIRRLDKKGQIDWSECFMDGTFVSAKKGAQKSGKRREERAPSSWWWRMAEVFLWECPLPLPVHMR
jgi:transposase